MLPLAIGSISVSEIQDFLLKCSFGAILHLRTPVLGEVS